MKTLRYKKYKRIRKGELVVWKIKTKTEWKGGSTVKQRKAEAVIRGITKNNSITP